MIIFEPPYLVVSAFIFFVWCAFFGAGAMVGEARLGGDHPGKWFLLVLPGLVGVGVLLFLTDYLHQILQNPALN